MLLLLPQGQDGFGRGLRIVKEATAARSHMLCQTCHCPACLLVLLQQGKNGFGRGATHCQGGHSSAVTQERQEAQKRQEQKAQEGEKQQEAQQAAQITQ